MNVEEILCVEICPELKYERNVYIYGTDRWAAKIFTQLCSFHIWACGFVSDESEEIDTFYHRPIWRIADLQTKDTLLISNKKIEWGGECIVCEDIVQINKGINREEVVIYGCGYAGRKLKTYLNNNGIKVKFYIDTNSQKVGTLVDNILVYNNQVLSTLKNTTSVVVAGKYWKEICDIVYSINSNISIFCLPNAKILEWLENQNNNEVVVDFEKNLRIIDIVSLEEYFKDKEIILFGSDIDLMNRYAKIYLLLGYSQIMIAVKRSTNITENKLSVPIIYIEDIQRKKDCIILLQDKCEIIKLQKLGFIDRIDYSIVGEPFTLNPCGQTLLDINLGYTWTFDDSDIHAGMYIFGENKHDDFKIAVLGDSTTESRESNIKSWPKILYDRYAREVGKITIFNFAVSGYSSGQCLLKMMRDVVLFKPNLIVLFGCHTNDCRGLVDNGIFSFCYLYHLFERLSEIYGKKISRRVYNECTFFKKWLMNIQYMNAVAHINNAEFYAFIQPVIFTKQKLTWHEKKMMKMQSTVHSDKMIENLVAFAEEANDIQARFPYIHDFSSIFDEEDVYMDFCHVRERGNEIIADKIWNVIKQEVKRIEIWS